ncbi:MAG: hypothetical protein AUJ98_00630 [Bacteroidetes bacterium CG2_30_33_31]|nr:MAG: hypothetical protein AUJ98_00630 [Bacteroidetes bacterium CG2_30_33_31]
MKTLKIFFKLIAVAVILIPFSACQKPGDLGADIVENSVNQLNMTFTDTISIDAYSTPVDSVSTSKLKYNLLGSYYDDVFGTTTASIYTQLRLSENNVNFGINAVCDSVILTLDYYGFYGDTASEQNLRVFEVSDDLYPDSIYFSSVSKNLIPSEIGIQKVVFNPKDSVSYSGVKVKPHLKLFLNNSFGEKIMAKSGQTELSDNTNFQKFMKGIYITADKAISKGGFAYFDLMSPLSFMSVYYHNTTDTSVYKFAINEYCSYFSKFEHYNYMDASADFKAQVIAGNKSLGNQKLYVQSLGGVKTVLKFPHLDELTKGGSIAVQNAQLLINIGSGTDVNNVPIYGLAIVKLDSLLTPQFIDDYYEGSSYFGGDYVTIDKNYKFNINRYLQSLVNGEAKQYGLEIIAKGASIYGNRIIFDGAKSTDRKLRLKLTYTKIKN